MCLNAAFAPALSAILAFVLGSCANAEPRGFAAPSEPAPASSNADPSLLAASTTTSAAPTSSAELPPATVLCEGLTQAGQLVEEIRVPWDPPEMLGGTLELGTYVLTQLLAFDGASPSGSSSDPGTVPPANPTPEAEQPQADLGQGNSSLAPPSGNPPIEVVAAARSAQAMISIEHYSLRWSSASSEFAEYTAAFLYTTDGMVLSLRSVCPTRTEQRVLRYSVVGNTLALLVDPTHVEYYSKL